MAVLNVVKKELTIFSERFAVLNLRSFDKNLIHGHGDPAKFDINKKPIEKGIKLME